MTAWLKKNWFLAGLGGAVLLAFLLPAPGASGGLLRSEVSTKGAVATIFVLQGLGLALEALRHGLYRWRLHLVVQSFTYVVTPLLGLALDSWVGRMLSPELRLGFLFLAVLPTTVSSAVVFTALAGGNTAGALVNTTLSNLLGVVVTPVWVGLLLEVRGESMAVLPLIRELALLVLLPLVLGQLMRPLLRSWIDRNKAIVGQASSVLILFIVYAAFCNSVASGIWTRYGWTPALWAGAGALVFFAVVLMLVILAVRWMRLSPADRTAALFCAPQKTLAAGVPMAKLIFASHPGLGLILLPVMFYHPLQLLVSGFLVNWIKARTPQAKT